MYSNKLDFFFFLVLGTKPLCIVKWVLKFKDTKREGRVREYLVGWIPLPLPSKAAGPTVGILWTNDLMDAFLFVNLVGFISFFSQEVKLKYCYFVCLPMERCAVSKRLDVFGYISNGLLCFSLPNQPYLPSFHNHYTPESLLSKSIIFVSMRVWRP